MPNWCTTNYLFFPRKNDAKGKKALSEFKTLLQEVVIVENNEIYGGSKITPFLGRLLESCNIDTTFNCRGYLFVGQDTKFNYGPALEVSTDTAWCHMPEVFTAVIKKCFANKDGEPLIDMLYVAEEPGCGLYVTNDSEGKWFSENLSIELRFYGEEDDCHVENEYEAMEYFDEFFEDNFDFNKFVEKWKESYQEDVKAIQKFYEKEKNSWKKGEDSYISWLYYYNKTAKIIESVETYESLYEKLSKGEKPNSYEEWVKLIEELAERDGEDGYISIEAYAIEDTSWNIETSPFAKKGETVIYKFFKDGKILIGEVSEIAEDGKLTIIQGTGLKYDFEIHPGNDGIILQKFNEVKEQAAEEAA